MAVYTIHCSTTVSYWLTVEAPDHDAVKRFYDGCDGSEFHGADGDAWTLDDIEEVQGESSGDSVDFVVDEDGEVIEDWKNDI